MNDNILADVQLIPVDRDLVSLSASAFDDRIVQALGRLSAAIAQNGQVLETLLSRVDSLETRLDAQTAKAEADFAHERDVTSTLREDIAATRRGLAEMGANVASLTAVESLKADLAELTVASTARFEVIENGKSESLMNAITSSSEKIVSRNMLSLEDRLGRKIASASDDLKSLFEKRVAEEITMFSSKTSQALDQQRGQIVELWEHRAAVIEDRADLSESRVSEILSRMLRMMNAGRNRDGRILQQALRAIRTRLQELSDGVGVLFSTFMLDPSVCFEFAHKDLKPKPDVKIVDFEPSISPEAVPKLDQMYSTVDDCKSYLEMHASEIEVCTNALISPIPSSWRSSVGPKELDHDSEIDTERKLAYLFQLPQSTRMHFMTQQEVKDRIDVLRSEVQHDMVTELLEMQREIKGKVAMSKLTEIMELHRDEQLYSTVKNLVSDIQDIRMSKLDIQNFSDAMKAKADTKALEAKVDVTDLSSQVDTINNSADRLQRELTRATERIRQIETSLINLQQYVVNGGGVYKTVAELNERLGPSAFEDQPHVSKGHFRGSRKSVSLDRTSLAAEGASPKSSALSPMADMIGRRPVAPKSLSMLEALNLSDPAIVTDTRQEEGKPVPGGSVVVVSSSHGVESSLRDVPEWTSDTLPTLASSSSPRKVAPPKGQRRPQTGGSTSPKMFTPTRPATGGTHSSGKSKDINFHLEGGSLNNKRHADSSYSSPLPLATGPSSVPMTASQRAYCEQLDLDSATTLKTLQSAVPSVTTRDARGLRPM